jgi:hypothetical protein
MTSDNYSLGTQAQALACLITLDQYTVPGPMRLFDTTLELVREFGQLAFAQPSAEQLRDLSARYAPLGNKPTFHAGVFRAILAFCDALSGRLEAASEGLADARLRKEQLPLHYTRQYRLVAKGQLLETAAQLSSA